MMEMTLNTISIGLSFSELLESGSIEDKMAEREEEETDEERENEEDESDGSEMYGEEGNTNEDRDNLSCESIPFKILDNSNSAMPLPIIMFVSVFISLLVFNSMPSNMLGL